MIVIIINNVSITIIGIINIIVLFNFHLIIIIYSHYYQCCKTMHMSEDSNALTHQE